MSNSITLSPLSVLLPAPSIISTLTTTSLLFNKACFGDKGYKSTRRQGNFVQGTLYFTLIRYALKVLSTSFLPPSFPFPSNRYDLSNLEPYSIPHSSSTQATASALLISRITCSPLSDPLSPRHASSLPYPSDPKPPPDSCV